MLLGRFSRLGVFSVSLALAGGSVSVAFAQPSATVSKEQAAEAKKHFDLGLKLYKEKETEAALLEFEKSYELGKRPSALRNKAQCLRDLKRSSEAFAAYQKLLDAHAAELKPNEKADIERAIEELKLLTGEVMFAVDQPDAEIAVDGKVVGTTPLFAAIRINSGTHKVRVTKAGFDTYEGDFTAVQQQLKKVEIHLAAVVTTGHVAVKEQNGARVTVFIDGKEMGPAPWEGDLAPGAHTVELKGEKLASESRTIDVVVKGKLDVVMAALALDGAISVAASPEGAHITIDGKEVGLTKYEGEIAPGTHQLSVTLPGFESFSAPLVIERGKTTSTTVKLVEERKLGPAKPTEDELYRGVYAKLGFHGYFGLHDPIVPQCSDFATNCTQSEKPFLWGTGMSLRVGHSWGYIGVEGVFSAQAHNHTTTLQFDPSVGSTGTGRESDKWSFWGWGAFFGPGVRASTHGDVVRATGGIAVGGIYKVFFAHEDYSGASGSQDFHKGVLYPGMLFDLGIELGSTPGTRFMLGVDLWLEFPGDVSFDDQPISTPLIAGSRDPSLARVTIPFHAQSTQYFIGPRLGFAFGR
ncbi:MAG: PEGA domain-containing protein [Polyangiales bacterium]